MYINIHGCKKINKNENEKNHNKGGDRTQIAANWSKPMLQNLKHQITKLHW